MSAPAVPLLGSPHVPGPPPPQTRSTYYPAEGSNKVAFRYFVDAPVEPPPHLLLCALPGDIYVSSVSVPGPNRTGRPMFMRCVHGALTQWNRLVDGVPGLGAVPYQHPVHERFSVRYLPADPNPEYIVQGTWNKMAQRKGFGKFCASASSTQLAPLPLPTSSTISPSLGTIASQDTPPSPQVDSTLPRPSSRLEQAAGTELEMAHVSPPPMVDNGSPVPPRKSVRMPEISKLLLKCPTAAGTRQANKAAKVLHSNVESLLAGTDASEDPKFTELQFLDPHLGDRISALLSENHVIVVRGCTTYLSWDEACLARYARLPDAIVTPHSQMQSLRGEPVHKECTFREFLNTADDPTDSLNLLDCTTDGLERPAFLRSILGHCDGTNNSHYLGLARDNFRTATTDMTSPMQWMLACHAGYYTHNHQDAEGSNTFGLVHTAEKYWFWFRADATTVEEALRYNKEFILGTGNHGTCYTRILQAGDMLIQPTYLPHSVYTPEKSIVSGGHFYAWQTLHLTEMARTIDVEHGAITTNEEHPSATRVLARMAISLGVGRLGLMAIPIRALHSLVRMMRTPEEYVPQNVDERMAAEVAQDKKTLPWREHRADILLARTVLDLIIWRDAKLGPVPDLRADIDGLAWDEAGPTCEFPPLPMRDICETLQALYQKKEKAGKELVSVPKATMSALQDLVGRGTLYNSPSPLTSIASEDDDVERNSGMLVKSIFDRHKRPLAEPLPSSEKPGKSWRNKM